MSTMTIDPDDPDAPALPVLGDELRLTDGSTATVLRRRYDDNEAPSIAGMWQVTGPEGARVVGLEDIVGYAEDEQTASDARVPVEIPGTDADHVMARVLNAAINWENTNHRLEHDGSMIASAAALRARNELREAIRVYMPFVAK